MAFNWFGLSASPIRSFEFRCERCGNIHRGSPSFANEAPFNYSELSAGERVARARLTDDTCVIDGESFFIRGTLEIPILDAEDPFCWGVWVSQSKESFKRYLATFQNDQSGDGSFGWLAVTMPGYRRNPDNEPIEHLACNVEWQGQGTRPLVFPQESDHPLFHDVMDGISWERAIELAQKVMHP